MYSYPEALSLECTSDSIEQLSYLLEICELFLKLLFNLRESPNGCYIFQLQNLVRLVFSDRSVKEEMVQTTSLHKKTRGKDIFQS
jgi:hypothetical protein